VQQLAAALDEFERLSHDHSREGSALLGRANKPGWLFAEAAEQAGKGAANSGAADAPSTAAAAAAAASGSTAAAAAGDVAQQDAADAAADEVTDPPVAAANPADTAGSSNVAGRRGGLDRLLGRHVNTRLLHMISLHMLIANTLIRVQLAHMLVGAWRNCILRVTSAVMPLSLYN
jgi:hypothetical protein